MNGVEESVRITPLDGGTSIKGQGGICGLFFNWCGLVRGFRVDHEQICSSKKFVSRAGFQSPNDGTVTDIDKMRLSDLLEDVTEQKVKVVA